MKFALTPGNIRMVREDLEKLPFVRWDRFNRDDEGDISIFGWIDREDGLKDYVEISYMKKDDNGEFTFLYGTSSAKYSAEIGRLLGFAEHNDCERVEHHFPVANVIRLEKPQ